MYSVNISFIFFFIFPFPGILVVQHKPSSKQTQAEVASSAEEDHYDASEDAEFDDGSEIDLNHNQMFSSFDAQEFCEGLAPMTLA